MGNMRTQEFKIGYVSKLVGIAPETIRYYERKGFVIPRISETGVRYYTMDDVSKMVHIRYYAGMGFSLDEANELMLIQAACVVADALEERACALTKEIEAKVRLLKGVRAKQAGLLGTLGCSDRFEIAVRPAMILLDTFRNSKPIDDDGRMQERVQFLNNVAYTDTFSRFCYKSLKEDPLNAVKYSGVLVLEKDVDKLDFTIRYGVRYAACRCLHTAIHMFRDTSADTLSRINEYIQANGLQVTGDIICRARLVYHSVGQGENLYQKYLAEVWVPI